jgi:hypothetical protein
MCGRFLSLAAVCSAERPQAQRLAEFAAAPGQALRSFGVLQLCLREGITKCRIKLGKVHTDDAVRPLPADYGFGTVIDVSAPITLAEVSDAVHRLGHSDRGILLLELGW